MTRPSIPLAAAEWASVQPDGTLWLAWEGVWPKACPLADPTDCNGEHCDCPQSTPVEFVQACAPCERRGVEHPGCGYLASHWCNKCGQVVPCPSCRIELVGPCPTCDGEPFDPKVHLGRCPDCDSTLTVTLGHAYAVGQPLPIVQVPFLSVRQTPFDFAHGHTGPLIEVTQNGRVLLWTHHDGGFRDITAAFAHYGPSETLVGRWAMQLGDFIPPKRPTTPPDETSYTCDWGHCDRHSVAWRYAVELNEYLPVCRLHRGHE